MPTPIAWALYSHYTLLARGRYAPGAFVYLTFLVVSMGVNRRENAEISHFKRIIKKVIALQILAAMILATAFWICYGVVAARSALVGGCISIVPSILFSYKALAKWGASRMREVLGQFYIAEAIKLVLTAALFVVAAMLLEVSYLPLIVGFILAQLIFVVAPMILTFKQ